jgi:hypothetical protein
LILVIMVKKNSFALFLLGAVALFSCAIYLTFSNARAGWGFPLDDAWIHQSFARNLASSGHWSFQHDQLSGGSTGPAWGFILALLYLVNAPPLLGTYLLGFLLLWSTAAAGRALVTKILPERKWYGLGAGILIALEWHLVWSALSGMETISLILLSLLFFNWLFSGKENWWVPGILVGLSAWIRPDGLSLVGPAILSLILRDYSRPGLYKKAGLFLVGLIAAGAPYFIFNWIVAGDLWPNTFYAKQAEYAVLRQTPLIVRYLQLGLQFVTGAGALLLPGVVLQLRESLKEKNWDQLAALIWSVGYIGLYAWRLPVVYQHGRYIMPALPVSYLLGFSGIVYFVDQKKDQLWKRIISKTWLVATVLVLGIFLILGGRGYSLDVAVINTEMVRTARWIADNLEEEAVIAAHDIGALGYYSQREIIDMAGLVSPDVIPFINDEDQLKTYLDQQNADYLVVFPGWYPTLTADLEVVYTTQGQFAPQFGYDNMTVFKWE